MQFLAVILVCAAGLAPRECTRDTALDLMVSPAPNDLTCMKDGETGAAHSLVESLKDGAYLKVVCERRKV